MKNIIAPVALVLLFACNNAPEASNTKAPADTTAHVRNTAARKAQKASIEYQSVIDYCMTNDSLSMWGTLCKYSKWSKDVHNGHYTLLCPTNKILNSKGRELLAALKNPANVALLDKLMARHLLPRTITVGELNTATVAKDAAGNSLEIKHSTIGGVRYGNEETYTQHGNVIVIDGVIDFPEEDLRKAAEKTQK